MKKNSAKEIIVPALSLFLIALVCSGLLALANKVTEPKIADINAAAELNSRREVLPSADTFTDEGEDKEKKVTYCTALGKNGETAGYVFVSQVKSYGGAMKVMIGTDAAGTLTGVRVLEIADTPGLGMNVKKDSFLSQFSGKSGTVAVTKDGGEINAVTSATISSRAVAKAVSNAAEVYNEITGGEVNG